MKKKEKSKYISHEKLVKVCELRSGYQIGKAFLKYSDDPVGMYKNKDWKIYVIPFLRYLKDEINFEEARAEVTKIFEYDWNILTSSWILHWRSLFYEMKTGRNFENDIRILDEGNEKDKKEVAINLVKAFKYPLEENVYIKELVNKNVNDDDFLGEIYKSRHSEYPDKKNYLHYLGFVRLNEEAIKSFSRKKIIEMAKEQGIIPKEPKKIYDVEESFLHYIRRLGVKKERLGRPQKVHDVLIKPKEDDQNFLEQHFEQHPEKTKGEFSLYLFGGFSKKSIENLIEEIKEQLKNKA